MALTDKQLAALNDPKTIVIFPAAGAESEIARAFIEANAPKVVAEERLFDTLDHRSLNSDMKVVVVYRDPRKPVFAYQVTLEGKMHSRRPEKELFDEVIVTQPVTPKYTREGPMKPYILDVAGFLEAMGLAMKHCRLDYIDKGAAKPQQMQVSWT